MKLHNVANGFPKGGISIDRKTPLGNPYVLGKNGCRQTSVARYRIYLYKKLMERDPLIEDYFKKLTPDSDIVCHCTPELCHGDVVMAFHEIISRGKDYEDGLWILKETKIPFIGIDPKEDGVSHINTYSRANTQLGRMLSNFQKASIRLKDHGHFWSIEGFWYWLSTGKKDDNLRRLYGYEAKKYGQGRERVEMDSLEFQEEVKRAITAKILQNPFILEPFVQSSSRLLHYYYYGDLENPKVVLCPNVDWMMDHLTSLRRNLKTMPGVVQDLSKEELDPKEYERILDAVTNEPEDIPF